MEWLQDVPESLRHLTAPRGDRVAPTRVAAGLIGVTPDSVRRWVNGGRFHVKRTFGGYVYNMRELQGPDARAARRDRRYTRYHRGLVPLGQASPQDVAAIFGCTQRHVRENWAQLGLPEPVISGNGILCWDEQVVLAAARAR